MNVIGASLLTDCGVAYPETLPALRALAALLRAADRTDAKGLLRQFRAVGHMEADGKLAIDLDEAQLRLVLAVNEALGLVRVSAVSRVANGRR